MFSIIYARVILARNVWTEKGLCDGSTGTVSDVAYKKSNHPPALPIVATVKFDDTYASPSFCLGLPKYVPITP